MSGIIHRILEMNPYPEYIIRRVYYGNKLFQKFGHRSTKKSAHIEKIPGQYEKLVEYINSLGINKGDILIVHSSLDALASAETDPRRYISMLLELVGEEGTLVLPAFPIYKSGEAGNGLLIYDPKKSPCWTGMLPNIFLRYPGVIRSDFPENPLAAKGYYAEEMMRRNLEGDLPHGKNSAWEFCIEHHAKVLFLGVESQQSATIVHAVEDIMDEAWPVKDWYEEKQYLIRKGSEVKPITFRRRKPYWSRFITAYYRTKVTEKKGFLYRTSLNGIHVEYIPDSKRLIDFLIDQAKKGETYYKIPNRLKKAKNE